MTHINRKFFDELAEVLRTNQMDSVFCWQVARVLKRNCMTFKEDWFISECKAPIAKPVLKLAAKKKVIPLHPQAAEYYETPSVPEIGAHKGRGMRFDYGSEFDVDGNERPLTKEEHDKHHKEAIEWMQKHGDRNDPASIEWMRRNSPKGWDEIEAGVDGTSEEEFHARLNPTGVKRDG